MKQTKEHIAKRVASWKKQSPGKKIGASLKGKKKTEAHKKKISEALRKGVRNGTIKAFGYGKPNPNYKGGVSSVNDLIRKSAEYKLWRESVFIRVDYTCRFCGARGGELNADHIKPFAQFPELRFAIDNGRTLCVPCHRSTDTYGKNL